MLTCSRTWMTWSNLLSASRSSVATLAVKRCKPGLSSLPVSVTAWVSPGLILVMRAVSGSLSPLTASETVSFSTGSGPAFLTWTAKPTRTPGRGTPACGAMSMMATFLGTRVPQRTRWTCAFSLISVRAALSSPDCCSQPIFCLIDTRMQIGREVDDVELVDEPFGGFEVGGGARTEQRFALAGTGDDL